MILANKQPPKNVYLLIDYEEFFYMEEIIKISTSVVAVLISVISLLYTNKIQRDSKKPYIAVYLNKFKISNVDLIFLTIKNFGKTGATILSVKSNIDLKTKAFEYDNNPLSNLKNIFIAPNQSFYSGLSTSNIQGKLNTDQFSITVTYLDNRNKKRVSSFNLNVNSAELLDHFSVVPNDAKGVERAIYLFASEYFAGRS